MSEPAPRLPLAVRQQMLLARSAELRTRLGAQLQPAQRPLRWADAAHEAWCWLRAHPLLPLAAAAGVLLARPRRAVGLAMSLWWGWRQWRRAQAWLQTAAPVRRR